MGNGHRMRSNYQAIKMLARNGWRPRHAVRLVIAIAVVFAATWQAWVEMAISAIRHDMARPSVLVIPVVVWLVWVRRPRFRFVRPGNTGIGWMMLAAGAQFFYMGHYFILAVATVAARSLFGFSFVVSREWLWVPWLCTLLAMRRPCLAYHRFKRRQPPNSLWRLF